MRGRTKRKQTDKKRKMADDTSTRKAGSQASDHRNKISKNPTNQTNKPKTNKTNKQKQKTKIVEQ